VNTLCRTHVFLLQIMPMFQHLSHPPTYSRPNRDCLTKNKEQFYRCLWKWRTTSLYMASLCPEIAFSWVRKWIMTYCLKGWGWLTAGAEMEQSGRHVSSRFNALNPFSFLLTQHLSQHPYTKQLHCCMLCSVTFGSAANTRVWPEVRHGVTRTGKLPNRLHNLRDWG
jgi:hypothetical protein